MSVERLCYICLETGPEQEENRWVSPCRCTGSMAWVHQECILRWIREQERHRVITIACSQCRTPFILLPEKGPVIHAMDILYKKVAPHCKLACGILLSILIFDAGCATIGTFALSQVYGVDEVMSMIEEEDTMEMVAQVHLVAYSLFFISSISWEDHLLRILQKLSHLPGLSKILPSDPPSHFHEVPSKKVSIDKIIGKAFLLPVISKIMGNIFFKPVESNLTRVLIGGGVFLVIKGGFYMYLKQKRLIRRTQIQIASVRRSNLYR